MFMLLKKYSKLLLLNKDIILSIFIFISVHESIPKNTPIEHAIRQIIMDSVTNCDLIVEFFAPIAFLFLSLLFFL